MIQRYLPVKESLGYKNLKIALMNVFGVNLDREKISEGEFENFKFILQYSELEVKIFISSTEKDVPFQYGEGGELGIYLANPDYPDKSILSEKSLNYFIEDMEKSKMVEFVSGKNVEKLEKALQILKEYLDS